MRSKLSKPLRVYFSERFLTQYPQFGLSKTDGPFAGMPLYRWDLSSRATLFVWLVISPNRDSFTLEGAWSGKAKFPIDLLPMDESQVRDHIAECGSEVTDVRFRIGIFFADRGDHWWDLSTLRPLWKLSAEDAANILIDLDERIESALPRIGPAVDDAIMRVDRHVMPLFQALAQTA